MAADFHQNHLTNDDSTTFFAINLGRHQSECFSQKCKRGSLDSRKNRVGGEHIVTSQFRPYSDLIAICLHSYRENHQMLSKSINLSSDLGNLTIQESEVDPGQSQRRPGLHVEC